MFLQWLCLVALHGQCVAFLPPPPRCLVLLVACLSVSSACLAIPCRLTGGNPWLSPASVPPTAEKLRTRARHGAQLPGGGRGVGSGVESCHLVIKNVPFPTTVTRHMKKPERVTQTQAR